MTTIEGVGTPTPPYLIGEIMQEHDTMQALDRQARRITELNTCRNERNMFVVEESIHHDTYRSTRRVEVYALDAVTINAILTSSAYCYSGFTGTDALHRLVEDLRERRENRSIGWSTFRLITQHDPF